MSSTPEPIRRHADDLTAADADAVLAFLEPRLLAQREGRRVTPAHRMATALDRIARHAAYDVDYHSRKLAKDDFRSSTDRLESLFALCDAWNLLWEAVSPWQEEAGYDRARWVHIEYTSAAVAEEAEARKAQIDAELQAEAEKSGA
ncbi:hypothetical protein ACODT4_44390 [Streptomyces sp. 2.9]|uniref:hypothetical protein n=1 Tax=Streptomyces tritrimontium TaxID=3406573 RepID=UPI003BB7BDAC